MTKENKIFLGLFLSGWLIVSLICFFGDRSTAVGTGGYSNFGYLFLSFFWSFIFWIFLLAVFIVLSLLFSKGELLENIRKERYVIQKLLVEKWKKRNETTFNTFFQEKYGEVVNTFGKEINDDMIRSLYDYYCYPREQFVHSSNSASEIGDYIRRITKSFEDECKKYQGRDIAYDKQCIEDLERTFTSEIKGTILVAHYCETELKKISTVPKDFSLSKLLANNGTSIYQQVSLFCEKHLIPPQFSSFKKLATVGATCLAIAYFANRELGFIEKLKKDELTIKDSKKKTEKENKK